MNTLKVTALLTFLIVGETGHADPLDNWTFRNLLPTGEVLSGITYGSGQFVTVGVAGSILTSTDVGTWVVQKLPGDDSLRAVGNGHGLFVAVGNAGTILTSADKVTWAQRLSGTTNDLRGIAFGNGLFVAVGDQGIVLTSSDGNIWVRHDSGQSLLVGIAFGCGLFAAVGTESILTSTDGDNWVSRLTGGAGFDSIAYGNGQFVAVANGLDITLAATSADGVTWITSIFDGYGASPRAIGYGGGYFAVVSNDGIWTLARDADWIKHSPSWIDSFHGAARDLWGIAFGNGHFVAVGRGGNIVESGSVVALNITAEPISGSLSLSVEGPTGLDYTIQTSSNLASWHDVTTVSNASFSKVILEGLHGAVDRQFYRVFSP